MTVIVITIWRKFMRIFAENQRVSASEEKYRRYEEVARTVKVNLPVYFEGVFEKHPPALTLALLSAEQGDVFSRKLAKTLASPEYADLRAEFLAGSKKLQSNPQTMRQTLIYIINNGKELLKFDDAQEKYWRYEEVAQTVKVKLPVYSEGVFNKHSPALTLAIISVQQGDANLADGIIFSPGPTFIQTLAKTLAAQEYAGIKAEIISCIEKLNNVPDSKKQSLIRTINSGEELLKADEAAKNREKADARYIRDLMSHIEATPGYTT